MGLLRPVIAEGTSSSLRPGSQRCLASTIVLWASVCTHCLPTCPDPSSALTTGLANSLSVTQWLLQTRPPDVASGRACLMPVGTPFFTAGLVLFAFNSPLPVAKSTASKRTRGHSPASQLRHTEVSTRERAVHCQSSLCLHETRRQPGCKSCKVLSGNLALGDFPLSPTLHPVCRTKAGKARASSPALQVLPAAFLLAPRHNPQVPSTEGLYHVQSAPQTPTADT